MICLLRNLEPQVQILDSLPIDTDTSVAANLSRLKYYRYKVAHSQTFTLSTEDFKIWWKHIAKVSVEFHYGITYLKCTNWFMIHPLKELDILKSSFP